ncbi:hypothetical protein [Kitasatospora sp. NPDC127060]|uniref:hypothetical protein n=1 Tax=Kitasatospora sp. NPDC127060 TaxID=3347121 RepID=UPI00364F568E
MTLPPQVLRATTTFLAAIDGSSPHLVEGLYLHGSLGFGEFYPGHSDIDYVAVLARPPDAATIAALAAAHQVVRERFPQPDFDGFHIQRSDLTRPPASCPDLPCTQGGVFQEAGRFDLNPVTWHELARHGLAVRGPALSEEQVWTDDAALRAYSHGNLAGYWTGVVHSLVQRPKKASTAEATEWCVLGVSRLHHLLATGTLTSKSGAGRYALTAFEPRWKPIITEALRIREIRSTRSPYADAPERRGQDTTAFTSMAVEAGLALGPQPG